VVEEEEEEYMNKYDTTEEEIVKTFQPSAGRGDRRQTESHYPMTPFSIASFL
jgi:hypothetical protein